jgi:hypothetical protein
MNIHIPPEALEAATRAYEDWLVHEEGDPIRDACLAMLANWPGMRQQINIMWSDARQEPAIILPLTESNDE